MKRDAHPGNAVLRCWQGLRRLFGGAPTRRRRRVPAAWRFESLEARRVMYGADLLGADLLGGAEGEAGSVVADFSLTDVNPNSVTFNQTVSPREFLQSATAWYFGHST